MASSSSSCSWRYDVFPSFSGEDVRKSLLSHLLKELHRKSINTFIDHGIERSRPIGPELLSAIRESRISIVVFSKNYASSSWCLNELVEIYKSFNELNQMVIPVFYNVDPSEVRKQTGEFGKIFEGTCNGKTEDQKQRWMQALAEVANMAGEDSRNWSDESNMIERTANDVSNKLLIIPSNDFGDFVGIEAHLEAMNSVLCLESEDVRVVGIVGPSGIGKSTIARALFSQLSSQFHYKAFVSYKRTIQDDYGMKLRWEEQFLSEILCHKEIKLFHLGAVEQRLKHKKVLIVLDDVDDIELLKTLVGQTGWFGLGSRIVVITKDKQLLRLHKIDLVYEVDYPSENLALQMFCRCSFGQNSPPDGFMKLAVEVANLAGNLPLGLNVLGSSLRRKDKEEWMKLLPRLRDGLDGKIEKTLRVSYDELEYKDQEVFLYIACLLNGQKVDYIKNLLGESVGMGLRMLADKSLVRITPSRGAVNMHSLLQKLGKEIVRAESIYNPGKRRFLVDSKDICEVLTENLGTENVLGMYFNTSELEEALFVNEESFKGMRNLTFLKVYKEWSRESGEGRLCLPRGYVYLPRKLRLLYWDEYLTFMHFNFRAEILVKLTMENSNLEKLWEGVQPLRSLKKIRLDGSTKLKEIPNLSNAINLEKLNFWGCTSLVTLPSSIRYLNKLRKVSMEGCTKIEALPTDINLGCLDYLNLGGCSRLRRFPRISKNISGLILDGTSIDDEESSDLENIYGLTKLDWNGCSMRSMPLDFRSENLVYLTMRGSKLEKLWDGVQSLGNLVRLDLSGCVNLNFFPDLSEATTLDYLELNDCKSLVVVPSSIRNLNKLTRLEMQGCTKLKVIPTELSMCGCKRLENISPNIFRLRSLKLVDFSDCGEVVTALSDASILATISIEDHFSLIPLFENTEERYKDGADIDWAGVSRNSEYLDFNNCFKLDRDARELIIRSYMKPTVLPGGEVPTYFTHRACGNSLTVTLPQSSLSQDFLGFKACIAVEPPNNTENVQMGLRWYLRGRSSVHHFMVYHHSFKMDEDHLLMFHFGFPLEEINYTSSELHYIHVEFEYCYHKYAASDIYGPDSNTQPCLLSLKMIKGCGLRLLNLSGSPYGAARISETEYGQQFGESDRESGRSNKRMRMMVRTSEEPSSLLCGKTVANTRLMTPNLELSLGQGETSTQMSLRSMIPSSSDSSSRFHGDGALLPSSEPCFRGKALYCDPMIREQQHTDTPFVDQSESPQLITF